MRIAEGRFVRIRYVRAEEHQVLVALEKNEEAKRFVGGPNRKSDASMMDMLKNPLPETMYWAVATSSEDIFVGRCGLLPTEEPEPSLEVHCVLEPAHWRKGFGKEVFAMLARVVIEKERKAVAYVHAENKASQVVLHCAGHIRDGICLKSGEQYGHFRYVYAGG